MATIAVTGGAGFVGSHLVDRLIRDGHTVRAIDNLSSGRIDNIKAHLSNPKFELITGDVSDNEMLQRVLRNSDAVVHLAAIVNILRSIEDPQLVNRVNVTGTLNVLRECVKLRVKRLVFASSAAVYGRAEHLPMKEESPSRPLSPYGSTKVAGEAYCQAYRETSGLETVILRFFNLYGPRRSTGLYSGVMVKFVQALSAGEPITIYGSGEQTRDFTYVADAVEGITLALEAEEASGEVINIGTGIPTSVNQLANLFISMDGNSGRRFQRIRYSNSRKGEVMHSWADISKAKRILGYEPRTDLPSGLANFIEWYLAKESQGAASMAARSGSAQEA